MGSDGVFLISAGTMAVLRGAPYETEDILQRALADFPEVLAGSATSGDQQGRLILIRREKGIPTTETGSATFSLDHLFVDAYGVPVIVEVKRSSDTRIRREVVGQMLDYAANGVKYWPVAELRGDFESRCVAAGEDPAAIIENATVGVGVEEFWQQVDQNLRSGHVRMVFVADRLPDELVRVIEFLNEQMSPAEVLGVEVQQFTNGDTRVLVPRLVGATTAAKATKERSTGVPWTADTFLDTAAERGATDAEQQMMQRCFTHASEKGSKLSWGKGITPGVSGWYPVNGTPRPVWTITASNGAPSSAARIYFYFPELREILSDEQFETFVKVLGQNAALASDIASKAHKYPVVPLKLLQPADLDSVLAAAEALNAVEEESVSYGSNVRSTS